MTRNAFIAGVVLAAAVPAAVWANELPRVWYTSYMRAMAIAESDDGAIAEGVAIGSNSVMAKAQLGDDGGPSACARADIEPSYSEQSSLRVHGWSDTIAGRSVVIYEDVPESPGLWVEPTADYGEGSVVTLEIVLGAYIVGDSMRSHFWFREYRQNPPLVSVHFGSDESVMQRFEVPVTVGTRYEVPFSIGVSGCGHYNLYAYFSIVPEPGAASGLVLLAGCCRRRR